MVANLFFSIITITWHAKCTIIAIGKGGVMKYLNILPLIAFIAILPATTLSANPLMMLDQAVINPSNCEIGFQGDTPELSMNESGEIGNIPCANIKNSAVTGACGCDKQGNLIVDPSNTTCIRLMQDPKNRY